ncbi:hypothetical protein [Amaricoccus solimangrovi]|uniref:Type II secretion system protein GspG C-terminal domain-containing protein n=1 Tax=Amaricoccus solimangrovi TaxID=2589815 RepID=A0A501WU75_9RHOB|nr:hypothetical protein [Amaricoccus solimangrovi]TPE49386.1 hypothetical protein FJM51_14770 [Amaricoccus solimangrovi]
MSFGQTPPLLSPRNRARAAVAVTGLVCAVVLGLSLALIGGPDAGRRDRRDTQRLADMREIAQALICHGDAKASPAQPAALGEISPACLAPGSEGRLRDPSTGAPYAIDWVDGRTARVCGALEDRARSWTSGWPPFDSASGCVTAALR